MAGPAIDWDWEQFALQQEAALIALWTIDGRPQAEIDRYLRETGYGKRLASPTLGRRADFVRPVAADEGTPRPQRAWIEPREVQGPGRTPQHPPCRQATGRGPLFGAPDVARCHVSVHACEDQPRSYAG